MGKQLSHVSDSGNARMVNISGKSPSLRHLALRAGLYAAIGGLLLSALIASRFIELLPHPPVLTYRQELQFLVVAASFGIAALFMSGRAFHQAIAVKCRKESRQAALGSLILSISVTLGTLIYLCCTQEWLINWIRSVLYHKFSL